VSFKVKRNYLEINSLQELNEGCKPSNDYTLQRVCPENFQLNKFFYKNIGKNHKWLDRLTWSDEKWISYVSSEKVYTYVFRYKENLVGFFELIFHSDNKETEIAYFGILEEYHNQRLGSHLLTEAIKKSFEKNSKRVWVHTCSLDHKNALKNYLARGMKIYKNETINI
jgi:ribosomal protein S18 acetylase RimI-like enzyme